MLNNFAGARYVSTYSYLAGNSGFDSHLIQRFVLGGNYCDIRPVIQLRNFFVVDMAQILKIFYLFSELFDLIAKRYTKLVFDKGPERSAQRNFAVAKASGDYVCIIDSDMELSEDVIASCVETVTEHKYGAVIIPEESFGEGFWAQCKKLERSFYVGVDWIEAARFFDKKIYQQAGGYNEHMTGGEDWDFTGRIRKIAEVGRSKAYIYHNEGRIYFGKTMRKIYYYASNSTAYFAEHKDQSALTDKSG